MKETANTNTLPRSNSPVGTRDKDEFADRAKDDARKNVPSVFLKLEIAFLKVRPLFENINNSRYFVIKPRIDS